MKIFLELYFLFMCLIFNLHCQEGERVQKIISMQSGNVYWIYAFIWNFLSLFLKIFKGPYATNKFPLPLALTKNHFVCKKLTIHISRPVYQVLEIFDSKLGKSVTNDYSLSRFCCQSYLPCPNAHSRFASIWSIILEITQHPCLLIKTPFIEKWRVRKSLDIAAFFLHLNYNKINFCNKYYKIKALLYF